jgi:hypothetical protein
MGSDLVDELRICVSLSPSWYRIVNIAVISINNFPHFIDRYSVLYTQW